MESEKSVPLPLSGDEVKEAAIAKVRECLDKSCHLAGGNAYTSVRFEIAIKMTLFDYGREVRNNEIATGEIDSGLPQEGAAEAIEETLTVEPMPPNQLRQDTGQAVPVQTVVDGKKITKHLRYAPRKAKA
jgi:hypothetical protein